VSLTTGMIGNDCQLSQDGGAEVIRTSIVTGIVAGWLVLVGDGEGSNLVGGV
jgi:hypothetical protein